MHPSCRLALLPLALIAVLCAPPCLPAQSVSLHRGRYLNSDGDIERSFPSYTLRADHDFARFLLGEVGLQYTPMELTYFTGTGGESRTHAAPRLAADVQLQLQAPLGRFRPYLGAGVGEFTYRRQAYDGHRYRLAGHTKFVDLGFRADVSRRWNVRAEMRVRADRPSFGYFAVDGEASVGLGYRW
jgi:hypothetical protein